MKKLVITLLLTVSVLAGFSQVYGPTTAIVGTSGSYYYYGSALASPYWSSNTGIITASDARHATVKWPTVGTGTLTIRDMTYPNYSYTISVSVVPFTTPTATAPTSITANGFTANWNSVSGAAGYRLDVSKSSSFSYFESGYNDLSVTSNYKVVTGLTPGLTYYYRVRAYSNISGTSLNSNRISVVTVPSAPQVPTYKVKTSPTTFTVSWNSSIGASGYYLDISTSETFSSFLNGYNNLKVTGALSKNVTVPDVCPDYYYYRVRAYNASGTSGNSSGTGIIPVQGPWTPAAYAATNVTSSSFVASWGNVITCTPIWRIQVAMDYSFSAASIILDKSVSGTSYTVNNLNAWLTRTFYYRVFSTWYVSNIVTVTLPLAKSTAVITDESFYNSQEKSAGVMYVYPNPVKEHLYVEGEVSGLVEITICSLDGAVVKQVRGFICEGIDVQDLKMGSYLLKVKDGEHSVTYTFIKQ